MTPAIEVSTDGGRIDRATLDRALDHSLCFGAIRAGDRLASRARSPTARPSVTSATCPCCRRGADAV